MKDRWLAWVPVLLLAALAALTYWLDQKVQPVGPGREGSPNDPDFTADNFTAMRMSITGVPRYAVTAKRLVHYPADNSALLEQPELTHFDQEKAPVSIRANQGVVDKNGENVYFNGDVQVRRAAYAEHEEVALYTDYLQVIPDQEVAKTDREVTMVSGKSTLKSVGLEFDNKTRMLTLRSNVRGTYQTPSKDRQKTPWGRHK
jgi:lipopolysaccharide export system protein LptC